MADFDWRPMRHDDVSAVVAVAVVAFPNHYEGSACFEERLALFPQGCFVLAADEAVMGYLIAYPWLPGEIPPLNTLLGRLPKASTALYLHDLALHPDMRGRGHVRAVVERLAHDARQWGFGQIALVSVNDTVRFWRALGFEPMTVDPAIACKLRSYGRDSTYMVSRLCRAE